MTAPFDLAQSIYRTVCWFSMFDYPLTAFEVWKWMYAPGRAVALADVCEALETDAWLAGKLVRSGGFVALAGKDVSVLVRSRGKRFLDAARKYGKLRRALTWVAAAPGVVGVAAVNTLSWWNTRETSDIDLFIVVKPGTIWSSRFFLVLPFMLLNKRPSRKHEVGIDPFCFSFFLSEATLNVEGLRLPEGDPYLAYWTKSVVPVFDRGHVFDAFARDAVWADVALPHARVRPLHPYLKPRWTPRMPNWQGGFVDRTLKGLQRKRFPTVIRELANTDTRVIVRDDMLKFHENDRRAEYRDDWEKMLATPDV
jgi:hypothetical protein